MEAMPELAWDQSGPPISSGRPESPPWGATMDDYDYGLPEEAIAQRPIEPRSAARLLVGPSAWPATGRWCTPRWPISPGCSARATWSSSTTPRCCRPGFADQDHRRGGRGAPAGGRLDGDRERWEALVRPGRRLPDPTLLYERGRRPSGGRGGPGAGSRGGRPAPGAGCWTPPWWNGPGPCRSRRTSGDRWRTRSGTRPCFRPRPPARRPLGRRPDRRPALHPGAAGPMPGGRGPGGPRRSGHRPRHLPAGHRPDARRPRDPHGALFGAPETMEACASADRVIAVGTTVVRALESAAGPGSLSGRTGLYIHGPFPFRVVDLLVTNFHLPRSSLLLLVEVVLRPACGGPCTPPRWTRATASSRSATPWWWPPRWPGPGPGG